MFQSDLSGMAAHALHAGRVVRLSKSASIGASIEPASLNGIDTDLEPRGFSISEPPCMEILPTLWCLKGL